MIVKSLEESILEHNSMIAKIITKCEYIIHNSPYLTEQAKDRKINEIIDIAKFYIQERRRI